MKHKINTHLPLYLAGSLAILLAACGNSTLPQNVATLPISPTSPVPLPIKGCSAQRSFAAPSIEQTAVTHFGRRVTPLGKLAAVGNFPGGGRLTPDGRFFWAIDNGRDINFAWVINANTGALVGKYPLPGGGGDVVFAPDGLTAYVPGEPQGGFRHPMGTPLKALTGNAIHVYTINASTGEATEQEPLLIPSSANAAQMVGSSRQNHSIVAGGGNTGNNFSEWPEGLAISKDGKTLVAALLNSDRAAIIDTASKAATVVTVGRYPRGAVIVDNFAYVSNTYDGTLSKINLTTKAVVTTLPLGLSGEDQGNLESHPLALAADPLLPRVYVSVANRDLVLVLDTSTDRFIQKMDLRRNQGKTGVGVSPLWLATSPDGCTLYVANAYENSIAAYALQDRIDSPTKAFQRIGSLPVGDYPTAVAVSGQKLVWLAGKGMGVNQGVGDEAPPRNKQFWQNGLVGSLDRPDDAYFQQMEAVVSQNLLADAQPTPTSTVLHGAAGSTPFSFAKSSQIEYVILVVKENRTYDQLFGDLKRGRGSARYQLYGDNCAASNTAFEGGDRNHPGCGITPNAHALVRRFPLLDNFMANSEQSQEGHIFSSGGWLTDYLQRSSHWNPSGRGRPYDIGLYPIAYPPSYFIFDQVKNAGITYRIFGERSGGLNPEASSQGAYRTADDVAELQANTNANYPINGLEACLTASAQNDPERTQFAGCVYDSSPRSQSRAAGANVAPDAALSRMRFFEADFTPRVAAGTWPKFTYMLLFNDHGAGNTPNNITEAAGIADNDLALGQLVDLVSKSSIWGKTAIFVMEDDSQDGADHIDSHRMPGYVISPWTWQDGRVISRRYDQLSMLRTVQMILGLAPPSLAHALAVPMYDVFQAPNPTNTPSTAGLMPYTAVLPERSLVEQNGKTAATRAFAKNAPELFALGLTLPKGETDWVPQSISDRIKYAGVWGDDKHYPGSGPNASLEEQNRAKALWADFRARKPLKPSLQEDDEP